MARPYRLRAHLVPRHGRFSLRYRDPPIGDQPGHIHEISTGTANRRLAERFLQDWLEEQRAQRLGQIQSCGLQEIFERFRDDLTANDRAAKYIQRAHHLAEVFLQLQKELGAGASPMALIEGFKLQAIRAGRSANGINSDLRLLKALFNWASDDSRRFCDSVKVRMLRPEHTLVRFLDQQEVEAFFGAIDAAPVRITRKRLHQDEAYWRAYWRLVFEVYLFSGGRKEEVARLTWADVDFGAGLIRFIKTKGKRERWVELEPWLMEKLKTFRDKQSAGNGRIWHHAGNWIYEAYVYYAKLAGFTDPGKLVLHCLRHSCVSHMLADGTDIRTVAEFIGHEDPALTLRIYAHVMPGSRREAARRLSRRLKR